MQNETPGDGRLPKVVLVPAEQVKPDPKNPRTHSAQQLDELEASIKLYGNLRHIVVDKRTQMIVGGHALYHVLTERLGWDQVPVQVVDMEDDAQRGLLRDALNQIGLNSGWDYQLLSESLRSASDAGLDLALHGFTDDIVEPLLAASFEPPPVDNNFGGEPEDEEAAGVVTLFFKMKTEHSERVAELLDDVRKLTGKMDANDSDAFLLLLPKAERAVKEKLQEKKDK